MKLYDRDFTYIPACSLGGIPDTTRKGLEVNGFVPNWWNEEKSFFFWPYILQSAHYVESNNWRDQLKIPDNVCVFGDSGGFQAINYGFDFDPISVLKWQERDCNIGIILDKPPVEMDGSWTAISAVSDKQFNKALDDTYKNVEMIIDKRAKHTKHDLKLYNVLQGTTPEEVSKWYHKLNEFELDGWSIGVKPPKPMMVAFLTGFLMDQGITGNVHLLGLSGHSSEAAAVYASQWLKPMVVDSSSYNRGCTAREYALPLDMRDKVWFGDIERSDKNSILEDFEQWPCLCPVCQNIPDPKDFVKMNGTIQGVLLSLHNLHWYVQLQQQLASIVHDRELFHRYVKKQCTPETLKAIEFIDHVVDHDFDSAVNKFYDRGVDTLDEFF